MCVTSVDPYWLAELGGVFFSIRERNFDGLARARAQKEFSRKTEMEAEMARQRDERERAQADKIAKAARTPRIGGVGTPARLASSVMAYSCAAAVYVRLPLGQGQWSASRGRRQAKSAGGRSANPFHAAGLKSAT